MILGLSSVIIVLLAWASNGAAAQEGCCEDRWCETYRGFLNVTVSGRTCQPWSQAPIRWFRPQYTRGKGLDSNYCRNPVGHRGAWCYTTDPKKRWDDCEVPRCSAPACKEMSPGTAQPVCDSNGKTHKSSCNFVNEQGKAPNSVTIAHVGACWDQCDDIPEFRSRGVCAVTGVIVGCTKYGRCWRQWKKGTVQGHCTPPYYYGDYKECSTHADCYGVAISINGCKRKQFFPIDYALPPV